MKVFPPILPQFVGTPPNPSKNANSCPLAGFRLLFAIRTSSNGNSPLRRQSPFSGLWELHFLCGFSPFVLLGIRPLHNLADNAWDSAVFKAGVLKSPQAKDELLC